MDVTCLHCATTFDFVDAGPDSPAICPSCGRETALPPSETEAGALAPGSDGEAEVCFHCGAPVTVTDGELIPICDKCRTVPPQAVDYDPLATVGDVSGGMEQGAPRLPPVVAGAFESAGKSDSLDEDAGPGFRSPDPISSGASGGVSYDTNADEGNLLATGPDLAPVATERPHSIESMADEDAGWSAEFDPTEQFVETPQADPDGLLAKLASAGEASDAGAQANVSGLSMDDPLATMAGLSAVDEEPASGEADALVDALVGSWEPQGPAPSADQMPSEDVPLEDAGPSEPDEGWRVLKENGQIYGPFPRTTLLRWAEERKLHAHEQVSLNGGEWAALGEQEAFAGVFSERLRGVDIPQPVAQDIRFKKRSPLREFFQAGSRNLFALGVLALVAAGVWYAVQTGATVIPESFIHGVRAQFEALRETSEPGPPVMSEGASTLLVDLAERHPRVEGTSWEHFLRGRTWMLQDTTSSLEAARQELEMAVLLDPHQPLASAALAELYNLLPSRKLGASDLRRQSIYLMELARVRGTWDAEVLRARASFLLHSGHFDEGREAAVQALQASDADPQVHFLLGLSSLGIDESLSDEVRTHFAKTLELDPGFHRVHFELGVVEERAGNLRAAADLYEKKIEVAPDSPRALTRLGGIHEMVGDVGQAASLFDEAITRDPHEKEAILRRAVLAYQFEGRAAAALQLLDSLEADGAPSLTIAESKQVAVHRSAVLRLLGRHEDALAEVQRILDDDPSHSPSLFHKALALAAQGKYFDSLPLFTQADSGRLPARTRATILFHEGRTAIKAGQLQDAAEAYERAIDTQPSFMPAFLWRVEVRLELGDAYLASAELLSHLGRDPLEYARVRDPTLYYEPPPDLNPLAARLLAAAESKGYAPQLHTSAGVVLFHDGQYSLAAQSLQRALGQSDRSETARFYLALVEYQRENMVAATAHLRALLGINHTRGVFHLYLGEALLRRERQADAIEAFEEAYSYGVRSSWAQSRLAVAVAGSGDAQRAEKILNDALKLDGSKVAPRRERFLLNL